MPDIRARTAAGTYISPSANSQRGAENLRVDFNPCPFRLPLSPDRTTHDTGGGEYSRWLALAKTAVFGRNTFECLFEFHGRFDLMDLLVVDLVLACDHRRTGSRAKKHVLQRNTTWYRSLQWVYKRRAARTRLRADTGGACLRNFPPPPSPPSLPLALVEWAAQP